MIKICLCLLALGIFFYDTSEGCGRVPATPPPPVSSTVSPTQSSRNESSRAEECTEEEINTTQCVDGQGKCYVLEIDFTRKPSCHCTYSYNGMRCELLNVEILYPGPSTDSVATAGIAASIAVIVVVAVVFVGVLIVYYRRRRQRNRMGKKPEHVAANGKLLLPENNIVSDASSEALQQPRNMQINGNGNYNNIPEEKISMFRTTSV